MTETKDAVLALACCRPEVRAFAVLMERELRANDHKPGWKHDNPVDLARRVREEAEELFTAVASTERIGFPEAIAEEAADVANMAMMAADVCGALTLAPLLDAPAGEDLREQIIEWGGRALVYPSIYMEGVPTQARRTMERVADALLPLITARIAQARAEGAAEERETSQAARDVLAERRRQVEAEGWAAAHDDEHWRGEMAMAAGCYALHSAGHGDAARFDAMGIWPWSRGWWKPKDRRRDLVRAGALILAEIERLDRASPLRARKEQAE